MLCLQLIIAKATGFVLLSPGCTVTFVIGPEQDLLIFRIICSISLLMETRFSTLIPPLRTRGA